MALRGSLVTAGSLVSFLGAAACSGEAPTASGSDAAGAAASEGWHSDAKGGAASAEGGQGDGAIAGVAETAAMAGAAGAPPVRDVVAGSSPTGAAGAPGADGVPDESTSVDAAGAPLSGGTAGSGGAGGVVPGGGAAGADAPLSAGAAATDVAGAAGAAADVGAELIAGDASAEEGGGADGDGPPLWGESAVTEEPSPEESPDACPFAGSITYELNQPETWPEDVVQKLTEAMDQAVYYYNCYADLEHHLTVNFKESVPTAEANVDGWMSFGSDRGYMVVATAMHEVAHTLGVGFAPWSELIVDGHWDGPNVKAFMQALPAAERDPDSYSQRDYITCDGQHFWPYGLNQAAEHQSEWSLINNVRIVAAMNADKAAYLGR